MDDSFFGALKGFLQIGIFIGATGFVLALMHPTDSSEFILSMCSGVIGLIMIVGVIIVLRMARARDNAHDRDDDPFA